MGVISILVIVVVAIVAIWLLSATLGLVASLIIPLIVWAIIGWLAGKLMRGRGYGTVGNILLGIGGGLLGSLLFRLIGFRWVENVWLVGSLIVGVVGALILIWLVRTFTDNKRFGL